MIGMEPVVTQSHAARLAGGMYLPAMRSLSEVDKILAVYQ